VGVVAQPLVGRGHPRGHQRPLAISERSLAPGVGAPVELVEAGGHGDDGGPSFHPCRRVQEALRSKGIEYAKVITAGGSPIPFLRKGSREELQAATGDTKLPALKLPGGAVITQSKAILAWVDQQS